MTVSAPGDYAVAYRCTDSHGLPAAHDAQVLVRDTTPPTLSWAPGSGGTVEHRSQRDSPLVDPGVVCTDGCDQRPYKHVQVEWVGEKFSDLALGTYKGATCFDHSGNSKAIVRDFVVVDRDAPVIALIGTATLTLEATHQGYLDQGATCHDYTAGVLNPTWDNNAVNMRVPGDYPCALTVSTRVATRYTRPVRSRWWTQRAPRSSSRVTTRSM